MKHYATGLVLALSALGVSAQEASEEVKVDPVVPVALGESTASAAPAGAIVLPEGVITEQQPLKTAYLAANKVAPAMFRPSQNMPDIVNEDLLRGKVDTGRAGKLSQFLGYIPKLKVLPCAVGCEGKDYDRTVKELVKSFRGDEKHFTERGEMIVQVRWFNVRSFLQRRLPYGADLFGISFMLEGKVISLGSSSGVGASASADQLARYMGARMAVDLLFSMGIGGKPSMLTAGFTKDDGSFAEGVSRLHTGMVGALGVEDIRSRIEPATDAYANLMPAIDGIKPNEILPITQVYYINSLLY